VQEVNCTELLTKANREIKCLKYKIQKVIPSSDSQLCIFPNRQFDIEIIAETYMSF